MYKPPPPPHVERDRGLNMMMKQFDRIAYLPGLGEITFFPWPRPLGSQLLYHSPRPPAPPPPQSSEFINKYCLGVSLKSGNIILFHR
jgi:hypothetical protein